MTTARLPLLLFLALSAAACGGRVIGDGAFDEDSATTGDSAATGETDTDVPADDTGIPVDDSSIPSDDTFIPEEDSSFIDTSVPPPDSTTPDSTTPDSTTPDSTTPDSITTDVPAIDTGKTDTSVTDSIVVDTGKPDGAIDTGPDSGTPIGTVCDKLATATCTPAYQTCCTSHGFTWDSLACSDVATLWCDSARDGVTAGKTTYDGTYADACASAWTAATSACSMSLVDWLKNRVPCSQLFNGKTLPGGTCTRDSDCHADPGSAAYCDTSSNRCRSYFIVGKSAACSYFGVTPRICDKGLYCDFTSGSVPTCKDAKPVGSSCFGIDDQSCGLGYTCKAGKCAVGAAAGATCARDLECASWSCSFGKCTDPNVLIANKALCSGI